MRADASVLPSDLRGAPMSFQTQGRKWALLNGYTIIYLRGWEVKQTKSELQC
jgi:hypothetical protein